MDQIIQIQDELEKVLKKKRFWHTIGVRYTAQAMAMHFGLDMVKAGFAGVLHDCAKYLSDEDMLRECRNYHIEINQFEKKQPSLLHAKLGAHYAKEKYNIDDEEILEAIRWHTTGKPEMTDFEKIIFIADYIEPERKMLPGMTKIREASFSDLNKAMYLILDNTISYLRENKQDDAIDDFSLRAYEYYREIVER